MNRFEFANNKYGKVYECLDVLEDCFSEMLTSGVIIPETYYKIISSIENIETDLRYITMGYSRKWELQIDSLSEIDAMSKPIDADEICVEEILKSCENVILEVLKNIFARTTIEVQQEDIDLIVQKIETEVNKD